MTWEIFLGIVALTGFVISIGKIVSANTKALTKLEDSINRLDKTLEKQGKNIDSLEQEVNEHETRISILEHK
jgi:cell division protein FtsL